MRTKYDQHHRRLRLLQLLKDSEMRFEDLVKTSKISRRTLNEDLRLHIARGSVEKVKLSHKHVVYRATATTEFEHKLHEAFKILFDALADEKLLKDYVKSQKIHASKVLQDSEKLRKFFLEHFERESHRGACIFNLAQITHELLIKLTYGNAIKTTNLYIGLFTKGKKRILNIKAPDKKEVEGLFETLE